MIINNSRDLEKVKTTLLTTDEIFTNIKLNKGALLEISNYGTIRNIITKQNEEKFNIENQLYVKIGSDFYLIALLVALHFISFETNYIKIDYFDSNPENLHVSNIKFTTK
jgi:hypothetical protein